MAGNDRGPVPVVGTNAVIIHTRSLTLQEAIHRMRAVLER
jgi:hypothetical protein